jgi:DNA-binding CsgD family transcriptional regulator/tetratricopeptide (TPR) repeat protein
LERSEQLAALAGWASEAARVGRVVLVAGEAGVGKTALVGAFLRGLSSRTPVFRGWCEALSTPRPLAPLLDVAAQCGGLLAEAVESDPRPPEVVGVLLQTMARWPGTVLVIEDLHWADDATLDLFRLISRRIADVPAQVVATYRDDEIGAVHPLRVLLGDLGTCSTVRRLPLVPLTEAAVAELAIGGGVDAGELFRLTAGNPFYVTEVLDAGVAGVPSTVRDAVLARAARLSASARRALEAAAAIGTPLDLGLLRAVAGEDADGLDECAEAGVLRTDGDRVAFRHELARRAVEQALAPARRSTLHGQILRHLLEAGHAPAARLAHHAAAAGDRSAVRGFAEQAARDAAWLGAHREAAAQFRRVLAVLDPTAEEERAGLLLQHARECSLSDQPAEAMACAEEALRIWRARGDGLREGDALQVLSRLAWMCERTKDAEPLVCAAVELLETLPPGPELARAYAQRARQSNHVNAHPSAAGWACRALDLAGDLGEEVAGPELVIDAGIDLGLARAVTEQDPTAGMALMEQGVRRARELRLDEPSARGLFQLGRAAWQLRWLTDAERRLRTGAEFSAGRGTEMFHDYCVALRAEVLLDLGDWAGAEALARQAWQRTTPRSSSTRTVMVCVALGQLNARRGTRDPTDFFGIADALVRALPGDPGLSHVAGSAEAAWLDGRLPEMADQLRGAVAELSGPDKVGSWQLAEACWWLRTAGGEVEPQGEGPFVAQTAGDWRTAVEGWRDLGMPYHRAQALAQADEVAPLREALKICQELGAVPLARRIAQRLRAVGVRDLPRLTGPAAPDNHVQITPREHEVLLLLADGLRDADIAGRLVISLRTVHHHVASLRAKLDAPSRTAAVAAATRLGLLTPQDSDT